jgi:hypothetical protein
MLPNLLVIGAAKCGTTSLHEHLNAHPEIAMSRENELDFFVEGSAVKAAFRSSVPRASLSPALREQLAAELAADVAQLRSHTGLALAWWSL